MKKLLIILGIIFLAAILFLGIAIGVAAVKGSALDKESKAYVDGNLPLIISAWDEQELLSRASPEFTQNIKKADLDRLFIGLSHKLGKMQSYEGSVGQSYVDYSVLSSHEGKVITAVYAAKATFANGPASIQVTLIKHGGKWQIKILEISSNALLQN